MTLVPILLYHGVTDDPSTGMASFTVRPAAFRAHLDMMMEMGCTALTIPELAECVGRPRPSLPHRPVAITFDDGWADTAAAGSELSLRGLKSTLYVTTGMLAPPRPGPEPASSMAPALAWSQLAELAVSGMEIGGHSHTHPQLDTLHPDAAAQEINGCKAMLEDELGRAVTTFAYPHGYSDRRVRSIVAAAGYRSACGVRNALSSTGDDVFTLARLTVMAATTHEQVASWLDGSGAPVARPREKLRTTLWRSYRRARGWRLPTL